MASVNKGPSIRCPGCNENVSLPAEACPNCGYNFREGRKPGTAPGAASGAAPGASQEAATDVAQESRKTYYLVGTLVAIVLVLIIAYAVHSPEPPKQPSAAEPAASQPQEPQPAVMGPALLRPQVPIGLAKDAASEVAKDHQAAEDVYQELQRDNQAGQ